MDQAIQMAGALMILGAFALTQFTKLGPRSTTYLGLNLVGSAILAGSAAFALQWGFFVLQVSWFFASLTSLWIRANERDAPR